MCHSERAPDTFRILVTTYKVMLVSAKAIHRPCKLGKVAVLRD